MIRVLARRKSLAMMVGPSVRSTSGLTSRFAVEIVGIIQDAPFFGQGQARESIGPLEQP
jgi:hypothetical protein